MYCSDVLCPDPLFEPARPRLDLKAPRSGSALCAPAATAPRGQLESTWSLDLKSKRSPRAVEPCLPSPVKAPPSGPGWIHEIKQDGFRILARRDSTGVRLITRAISRGHQLHSLGDNSWPVHTNIPSVPDQRETNDTGLAATTHNRA
jgi:hypothetical protein